MVSSTNYDLAWVISDSIKLMILLGQMVFMLVGSSKTQLNPLKQKTKWLNALGLIPHFFLFLGVHEPLYFGWQAYLGLLALVNYFIITPGICVLYMLASANYMAAGSQTPAWIWSCSLFLCGWAFVFVTLGHILTIIFNRERFLIFRRIANVIPCIFAVCMALHSVYFLREKLIRTLSLRKAHLDTTTKYSNTMKQSGKLVESPKSASGENSLTKQSDESKNAKYTQITQTKLQIKKSSESVRFCRKVAMQRENTSTSAVTELGLQLNRGSEVKPMRLNQNPLSDNDDSSICRVPTPSLPISPSVVDHSKNNKGNGVKQHFATCKQSSLHIDYKSKFDRATKKRRNQIRKLTWILLTCWIPLIALTIVEIFLAINQLGSTKYSVAKDFEARNYDLLEDITYYAGIGIGVILQYVVSPWE